MWRDVKGYGRMWRYIELGCGRVWRDEKGCVMMGRNVEVN